MRTLILMRHAKAEAKAASGEDFDRSLTERGYQDAALMGRVLRDAGFRPDLALVSAAERTRQTWAGVAETFPEAEVRYDRRLYNASSGGIRDAVERAGEAADTILVIAHNPGIAMAMLELMVEGAEAASALEKARGSFPTASMAVFQFDAALRPRFFNRYIAGDYGGGAGE
jgi:phosphohistidine phosphatase